MTDLPPCPRCRTAIQPDWDWCKACGYDPLGRRPDEPDGAPTPSEGAGAPTASPEAPPLDPPRPRNVYEPEESTSPALTYGLIGLVALVVIGLFGLGVLRQLEDDPTPSANPFIPGGEVDFERGISDAGDGWSRIEVDQGAVTVELPGPLLRSRAEPLVADVGPLPMAVWGGGQADGDVYGVAVAEVPTAWRGRTTELLQDVPLPVDLEVLERARRSTQVDGRPAVEISAAGPDGDLWALVVVNDERLITVLHGSSTRDGTATVRDRIADSIRLG